MKKILVVGGTGFVASAFAKATAGEIPIQLTTRAGGAGSLPLDLEHPERFSFAAIEPGDGVLFAAAISSPDLCAKNPALAQQVNVAGPAYFIREAAQRGARVLFLSSDTVLGPTAGPTDETAVPNPFGDYAKMKRAAEEIFLRAGTARVVRLSLVISLRDKFSSYVVKAVQQGAPITLLHPIYRNAIHVLDVVQLAQRIFQHWESDPHPLVHAGGIRCLSRLGVAEQLFESLGYSGAFAVERPAPDFYLHRPERIMMDSPMLTKILGRKPLSLAAGYQAELADSSLENRKT